MKLYPFYLFYLLTITLLAIGLFATDTEIFYSMSSSESGIAVEKNLNRPFFLLASFVSLLTGLIYQMLLKFSRIASKSLVIIHFLLAIFGVIFALNIYRLILLLVDSGTPDTTSLAAGGGGLLPMFLGILIVIASIVIFIVAIATTKRIQK